jgi:hypothetical protein
VYNLSEIISGPPPSASVVVTWRMKLYKTKPPTPYLESAEQQTQNYEITFPFPLQIFPVLCQ